MRRLQTVVLTGGPSGGKSTLQKHIQEQFPQVYCAPEAATMLLSGGFPAPNEAHPWDEAWQRDLQIAVAAGQSALENIAQRRAKREAKTLIAYDRGLLDGAAYLPGGTTELEWLTGNSEANMLNHYDVVLHLRTTAAHAAYSKDSNEHRFEDASAALELDQRIMDAWQNHPNRIVLDEQDESERMARGLQVVRMMLET